MISLLYHSHTVVPAHLAELEALGLMEPDEQILVALDGVLLDGDGRRLSGPTLYDYCLISSLRLILWARDYGRHVCYAFPLAELTTIEGAGIDPLHAQLDLSFTAPEEEEQHFTLALLPLASLHPAVQLLQLARDTARALVGQELDAYEAGAEILAVLSEQIYGDADGLRPNETPYRWPGASTAQTIVAPAPAFNVDPNSLPPGQVYTASRIARSAWDTLRRSIREADLSMPFDVNSGSLRELTDAVRAINDLVHTVASNPSAQQMAMAFLNRQGGQPGFGGGFPPADPAAAPADYAYNEAADAEQPERAEPPPPAASSYHEIPLRRRGDAPAPEAAQEAVASPSPSTGARQPPDPESSDSEHIPDRREIPLRRRSGSTVTSKPFTHNQFKASMSGSGDAGADDRSPL
ncbi:hypothetical protein [Candidatus Viridilinea mediisalina]|uniref:Uncharacterized protein n=1 Tax=Candidatus Viridilinea mediisalina TaxID=2024553 RepID=A0A2A6RMK5_9CHLR|nr:hypothetical protein [Candidatus Viridilinea mediisalina]PDW04118.1 hypothetical protein CJ255_05345 [Candidatus Viridilinea mediisalina]